MTNVHIPVLQKEVLQYLNPKPNENFIDATIGEAGHTLAILGRNGPKGKVLGIEWDPEIIKNLESRISNIEFRKRLILVCDNFANLEEIVKKEKFGKVKGILFDLGMSSWHLEESGRGFSFLRNEPLDMRYSPLNQLTAEKIVNYWSESEIEKILKECGEERFAKKISKQIIETRRLKPIKTTFQLVGIIKCAVPTWYQHQKIHFATKAFQALRIAVNDELNNLKKVLPQALEVLKKNGRLVIIFFHSLEDRVVKHFFQEYSHGRIRISRAEGERALFACKILTKKPVRPSNDEIKINPRSRSAKLRAVLKL
jgi:16S rRNA (cytosine1402-N4)-methyltransferase